jgi:hypothetical protein
VEVALNRVWDESPRHWELVRNGRRRLGQECRKQREVLKKEREM